METVQFPLELLCVDQGNSAQFHDFQKMLALNSIIVAILRLCYYCYLFLQYQHVPKVRQLQQSKGLLRSIT